jgi:hypothetical protein
MQLERQDFADWNQFRPASNRNKNNGRMTDAMVWGEAKDVHKSHAQGKRFPETRQQ